MSFVRELQTNYRREIPILSSRRATKQREKRQEARRHKKVDDGDSGIDVEPISEDEETTEDNVKENIVEEMQKKIEKQTILIAKQKELIEKLRNNQSDKN